MTVMSTEKSSAMVKVMANERPSAMATGITATANVMLNVNPSATETANVTATEKATVTMNEKAILTTIEGVAGKAIGKGNAAMTGTATEMANETMYERMTETSTASPTARVTETLTGMVIVTVKAISRMMTTAAAME